MRPRPSACTWAARSAAGRLEGCVLTCPWHGWQYDVRTGENEFDRALKLETYEVVVEDGEVKVVL